MTGKKTTMVAVVATLIGVALTLSTAASRLSSRVADKTPVLQKADLNHASATVTLTFEGLLALCVNEKNEVEIGTLRNPHHELTIEVTTIRRNGKSTVRFPVNPDNDIWVETVGSGKGVSLYKNDKVPFNRAEDKGDPEDLRWTMDLEGPDFHDGKLRIRDPKIFRPRLHITTGTFYTQRLYDLPQAVTVAGDEVHWKYLGGIADVIAADITLDKNATELLLRSGDKGSTLRLRGGSGIRYQIAVKNTRHQGERASDFDSWYEAFEDPRGRKFDLRNVILNTGAGFPVRYLDNTPLICIATFLSKTRGFGE